MTGLQDSGFAAPSPCDDLGEQKDDGLDQGSLKGRRRGVGGEWCPLGRAVSCAGAWSEHLAADLSGPAPWALVEQRHSRLKEFDADRAIFVNNAGALIPIGFASEVNSLADRANLLLIRP